MHKKLISSIELAKEIRKLSLEMVVRSRASHIGSALSITDVLAVLYFDLMNIFPNDAENENRDIFILSKGHACVSLYATLGLKGFFELKDLETYGLDDSNFMNHISHKVSGVEFSTGSLGHGLPFATGIALGKKIKKHNNKVIVVVGDGELDEGSNWEALLFASHHKLDNLTIIVDYNNLQSLTTVKETLNLEPLQDKFESFGCKVIEVNGHNHIELRNVFEQSINNHTGKPIVIIAKTTKGKGVSYMENKVKWHYSTPNENELKQALNEIENA
jgi:transketolase